MKRALSLARRARGRTAPNPPVGAVLVRGGRSVGAGLHTRTGSDHAEVRALDAAGRAARGATLYVTLEPCSHHGRTPPCVERVLASGVKRVVCGLRDPDPRKKSRVGSSPSRPESARRPPKSTLHRGIPTRQSHFQEDVRQILAHKGSARPGQNCAGRSNPCPARIFPTAQPRGWGGPGDGKGPGPSGPVP